jgi:hypothetical protein
MRIKLMALACSIGLFLALGIVLRLLERDLLGGPPATAAQALRSQGPSASAGASAPPVSVPASDTYAGIRTFALDWFSRTGSAKSAAELARFYSDEVDYHGRHGVSRTAVLRDKSTLLQRWPRRSFKVAGEPQINAGAQAGTVRIRFPYVYAVSNAGDSRNGEGFVDLLLRASDADWLIVREDGTPTADGRR